MNILFITIGQLADIGAPGIYTDLLREFKRNGHEVYVITARERRNNLPTEYRDESGFHFLRVRIGNITRCGIIEKGISTVMVEKQYVRALMQYLRNIRFDLVLYTTPPITFLKTVEYVKKRDGAKTYLLLKDIFPQNAVDIGLMSKEGLKGILYRHFRKQEKRLYGISDRIGCMSRANVDYVIAHNPEVNPKNVEVCPNSMEITDKSIDAETREHIRKKYDIPQDKKIFVYGGNIGKPQGVPFVIDCVRKCKDLKEAFFLIVGNGTDYHLLEEFVQKEQPGNMKLMQRLQKEDYDTMVGACDVGLVFLDHRFTIPNFPSRLLSYMQAGLPVLACTDTASDIGKVVLEGNAGWWCESNDAEGFRTAVSVACTDDLQAKGRNSYEYMARHYSVEDSYATIMKRFGENA